MGFTAAIIFLAAILALAVVAWGAFTKQKSVVVALVALAVVGVAGLLSWYALIETQSTPWTMGYGAVAIASTAVAARHLLPKWRGSAP
jgi:hypothetical protein